MVRFLRSGSWKVGRLQWLHDPITVPSCFARLRKPWRSWWPIAALEKNIRQDIFMEAFKISLLSATKCQIARHKAITAGIQHHDHSKLPKKHSDLCLMIIIIVIFIFPLTTSSPFWWIWPWAGVCGEGSPKLPRQCLETTVFVLFYNFFSSQHATNLALVLIESLSPPHCDHFISVWTQCARRGTGTGGGFTSFG